jgi:G:T-mismatch repair DNA endonuclease (very short patch repair protein)
VLFLGYADLGGVAAVCDASLNLLETAGWRVLTVWECETADPGRLERIFRKYFNVSRRGV